MSAMQQPSSASATNPTPPVLPHITPDERRLLQRVINIYHQRLLAAWRSATNGTEAVPDSHVAPPSIAGWPREQIQKAVENFRNHLKWFYCLRMGVAAPERRLVHLAALGVKGTATAFTWRALEGLLVTLERDYNPRLVPVWRSFVEERRRARLGM
ncbi:hypothetical protein EDC01DRAFT_629218 [Geopyxis carbonaria]|nr:hypothetical protein EDC01DRAFT_629218 [Geopyxis carbonaria]